MQLPPLTEEFMRPLFIPLDIKKYWIENFDMEKLARETKRAYQNLWTGNPDASIIIPAYNEEKTIVRTLNSMCKNITSYPVEIIVVDNNSKDNTAHLVEACGIKCILETRQGIMSARNCGLAHARGKYIINADADTIYPKNWIQELIEPLKNNKWMAMTYGKYSFLPEKNTRRFVYFLYESVTDIWKWLNKYFRDEALNVYGCCSAFRREDALQVDGYNHPPGACEDGYLALKLRNKGLGKLFYVKRALVWTTDRRIHSDGGILTATLKKLKRIVGPG
jgi:glycosyltransferase involved in cell wall biosynthesis